MADLAGHGATRHQQVLDLEQYQEVLQRKPGALTGSRPQQQWGSARAMASELGSFVVEPSDTVPSPAPRPGADSTHSNKVTVNQGGAKSDESWANQIDERRD
jgi:hypothetical protein